jgi:hypothetical protein
MELMCGECRSLGSELMRRRGISEDVFWTSEPGSGDSLQRYLDRTRERLRNSTECTGVEMEYKYKNVLRRYDLKHMWVPIRAKRAGSDRPSQAKELLCR